MQLLIALILLLLVVQVNAQDSTKWGVIVRDTFITNTAPPDIYYDKLFESQKVDTIPKNFSQYLNPKNAYSSNNYFNQYEALVFKLGGDSLRYCGNYLCNNWIEDLYSTGQVVHRGFYINGILESYYNYYPDGTKEREFRVLNDNDYFYRLYYPNGNLRIEKYIYRGVTKELNLFFKNGVLKEKILINTKTEQLISRKTFDRENNLIYSVEFNEDENNYFEKTYFSNGVLREETLVEIPNVTEPYIQVAPKKIYKPDGSLKETIQF